MRQFQIVILCATIFMVGLGIIYAQEPKKLSEINQLKAENFKLKAQLTQCQITVNSGVLSKEQQELVENFRKELGANEKDSFDWNSLTFKPSSNPK